jgi:hypothetical protein
LCSGFLFKKESSGGAVSARIHQKWGLFENYLLYKIFERKYTGISHFKSYHPRQNLLLKLHAMRNPSPDSGKSVLGIRDI